MKRSAKHTTTSKKATINKFRHYLSAGLGLLFLAASLALTGCDSVTGSTSSNEGERITVPPPDCPSSNIKINEQKICEER